MRKYAKVCKIMQKKCNFFFKFWENTWVSTRNVQGKTGKVLRINWKSAGKLSGKYQKNTWKVTRNYWESTKKEPKQCMESP